MNALHLMLMYHELFIIKFPGFPEENTFLLALKTYWFLSSSSFFLFFAFELVYNAIPATIKEGRCLVQFFHPVVHLSQCTRKYWRESPSPSCSSRRQAACCFNPQLSHIQWFKKRNTHSHYLKPICWHLFSWVSWFINLWEFGVQQMVAIL